MSRRVPSLLVAALCLGLAGALLLRANVLVAVAAGASAVAVAVGAREPRVRVVAVAVTLALVGWWWASHRLAMLDASVLVPRIGTAERAVVEIQEPPRPGRFETRVRALVVRWGELRPSEPVLLELPPGRAPPQGATWHCSASCASRAGRHMDSTRSHGSVITGSTPCCAPTPGEWSDDAVASAASPTDYTRGSRATARRVSAASGKP